MTVPSRSHLDLTGERLRDGTASGDDWRLLREYRTWIRDSVAPLLALVRELAETEGIVFSTRLKTDYSIVEKLRRSTLRLRQVDDIMGCRIIVGDVPAQDEIVRRIAALGASKTRDRRLHPSSGYRAVHVILGSSPFLEVQIRTRRQDAWAELSERIADRYGIHVKYGAGPDRLRKMLDALSEYIARLEDAATSGRDISLLPDFASHDRASSDARTTLAEIRDLL